MKKLQGFTVIEIFVVMVILITASVLFINQKQSLEATARDNERRTDINTLYHNLTKVYYKKNQSYPKELNTKSLPAVLPESLKDPRGVTINEQSDTPTSEGKYDSDYTYTPIGCDQKTNECKGFKLRTSLENEDDFKKSVEVKD